MKNKQTEAALTRWSNTMREGGYARIPNVLDLERLYHEARIAWNLPDSESLEGFFARAYLKGFVNGSDTFSVVAHDALHGTLLPDPLPEPTPVLVPAMVKKNSITNLWGLLP